MSFSQSWQIPTDSGKSQLQLSLKSGHVITFVGRNGAGKSTLISWLNGQSSENPIKRIVAHRRIWLNSSGPELTASTREQYVNILSRHDRSPSSRTNGQYEEQRVSSILYDLMGKENGRNSRFVKCVEAGLPTEEIEASLLTTISNIMIDADIDLQFEITDNMGFSAVRGNNPYPISAMSDGEKAALLLAAEVLLAPRNSILLLDEPERHFHRSISPKLISALIKTRNDCGFIISTHDINLVEHMSHLNNSTYLVNNITWSNDETPTGWDIYNLSVDESINERAKQVILGGRQEVLFIEGNVRSLDLALYKVLFPTYSVTSMGSSDEVQRAVSGLQSAVNLHWITAKGIIDGDARSKEEIDQLREKDILVLPVNEIESLYYLPQIITAQAQRQASHIGADWNVLVESAHAEALVSLKRTGVMENLAATNAEKILRRSAMAKLPTKNELKESNKDIPLTLSSPFPEELEALKEAVRNEDLAAIVKKYSIRDSGLPNAIARALKYGSKENYQRAVITTVQGDGRLKKALENYLKTGILNESSFTN